MVNNQPLIFLALAFINAELTTSLGIPFNEFLSETTNLKLLIESKIFSSKEDDNFDKLL